MDYYLVTEYTICWDEGIFENITVLIYIFLFKYYLERLEEFHHY